VILDYTNYIGKVKGFSSDFPEFHQHSEKRFAFRIEAGIIEVLPVSLNHPIVVLFQFGLGDESAHLISSFLLDELYATHQRKSSREFILGHKSFICNDLQLLGFGWTLLPMRI
jgi:hypothetical protein